MDNDFIKDLVQSIKIRLGALGYQLKDTDDPLLEFETEKMCAFVVDEINTTTIPARIKFLMIDVIVAEYLNMKLINGQLGDNFDAEVAVKKLSEGGRSITFNVGAPIEERFESIISKKMEQLHERFGSHRRMEW